MSGREKHKQKRRRLESSASAPPQSSSILSFFAPQPTPTATEQAPLQTVPTPPLNEEVPNRAPSAPPPSSLEEERKKDEEEGLASSDLASELAADPLEEDVDISAANDGDDDVESSHGPLIDPFGRSSRCAPLQLLNMKLSSRPLSSPVPPCLAKAGGKRFSRRVRCASDVPRDDCDPSASSLRRRRAVTGVSLSPDGLLLAVGWADGRVSVYHADDVEYNDAMVDFRGGEPGEPDKERPLEPLVTFKQFAEDRRPSTLTWHPDRDVLYVTYASSLNVTVIDWDEYMGAPRLPAAPFLKARGVRPVPNRAHLNFTEDTVTSLAVLPAEKKGRFRMLIIGTAKGQVLCYCTAPHKSAREAVMWSFRQKLDKRLYESVSSSREKAASTPSNSVTAVVPLGNGAFATTSLNGQINVYSLTKFKSALMSSVKQPAVLATFDVRAYLDSASCIGFGVATAFEISGGGVMGVMLDNGEMLRLRLKKAGKEKKAGYELELQAKITHGYTRACILANGRGEVLDGRYSESLNIGVGMGGGAFAKLKPYYPVRTEDVTRRLRSELNGPISEFTFGETEHLRVRDEMESELVFQVELIRGWHNGCEKEASSQFKKLGEKPTALASICDGRYVVVGDREGKLMFYG